MLTSSGKEVFRQSKISHNYNFIGMNIRFSPKQKSELIAFPSDTRIHI